MFKAARGIEDIYELTYIRKNGRRLFAVVSDVLKHAQLGEAQTTVEHDCTTSIGTTLFINHEDNEDAILKQADSAMYQTK